MNQIRVRTIAIITFTLFMSALTLPSAHAAVSKAGLYGTTDPQYDGTYRQSLVLIALVGAKVKPAALAITWLTSQQCSDGGFTSYREDVALACDPSNEDSNSTAIAASALRAVGKSSAALRASAWLLSHRNMDGGIGYNPLAAKSADYDPTASDANSTGLMLLAFNTNYPGKYLATTTSTLSKYQVPCTAQTGAGALDYQISPTLAANDYATAQATFGLTGAVLPLIKIKSQTAPKSPCPGGKSTLTSVRDSAILYLAGRLTSNPRGLPSAFGPGTDWNATAWATLALLGSGYRHPAIATAIAAMADGAMAWGFDPKTNEAKPGALAMMLITGVATNLDIKHFGGIDLTQAITGSMNSK